LQKDLFKQEYCSSVEVKAGKQVLNTSLQC